MTYGPVILASGMPENQFSYPMCFESNEAMTGLNELYEILKRSRELDFCFLDFVKLKLYVMDDRRKIEKMLDFSDPIMGNVKFAKHPNAWRFRFIHPKMFDYTYKVDKDVVDRMKEAYFNNK